MVCGPVRVHSRGGGKFRCGNAKNSTRMEKHGLTTEEAHAMKDGAECAICGSSKKLVIDHDHMTMKIRGVLCTWCNVSIGMMNDSPDRLRKAADYLET